MGVLWYTHTHTHVYTHAHTHTHSQGYLDQTEYVPLFLPSLTPPTVDQTTPPTLGTLTTCLSVGLDLLKKVVTW